MLQFLAENVAEMLHQTLEHLWLSGVSIFLSTIAGISLGIYLTRIPKLAGLVIGATGVLQTIPSLALLGLFIPLFGIGKLPAIIALFLYALLPIVRNTYTGLIGIDPNIKEAAIGMGMTRLQLLRMLEFPLALPVIFAGVRTAAVINVGVATLCALIGAGGLGEFIFRGISLNQSQMILAGAVPASLLAIGIDYILSSVQANVTKRFWPFVGCVVVIASLLPLFIFTFPASKVDRQIVAGFNSEFMNRADGWPGLSQTYGLEIPTVELEITLMYEALKNNEVDVIAGFTTDGRIGLYGFTPLEDDLHYFPPYHAAPITRLKTLEKFPALQKAFDDLEGKISTNLMAQLNLLVDTQKMTIEEAADSLMQSLNRRAAPLISGKRTEDKIVIGSKAFTESYILAQFFSLYIETYTSYETELRLGFGGTQLLFEALSYGHIDIYPEYTGTAWLLFTNPTEDVIDSLKTFPQQLLIHINQQLKTKHQQILLPPLGFNNTTALMIREKDAVGLKIKSISDLKNYVIRLEGSGN